MGPVQATAHVDLECVRSQRKQSSAHIAHGSAQAAVHTASRLTFVTLQDQVVKLEKMKVEKEKENEVSAKQAAATVLSR